MEMESFEKRLEETAPGKVKKQELMSGHTTFRTGGPAEFFVTPDSAEMTARLIGLCKEEKIPYYMIGNGSNLLVGDRGIRGVVIQTQKEMQQIRTEGNVIRAQAGALLSKIAAEALANGLTGFEFAAGIPGTLGGACVMNAGAYGGEMKQVLREVTLLDASGMLCCMKTDELELGYRTSRIAKEGYIVLEAAIELEKGNPTSIRQTMDELKNRRVEKQPLEYPSAGSTFKRPEGYFAGKLIEDAGLRGFSVGGAQVSEKHCGFVINKDNATSADILELIEKVAEIVWDRFRVKLEPEVKMIGEF